MRPPRVCPQKYHDQPRQYKSYLKSALVLIMWAFGVLPFFYAPTIPWLE